MEEKITVTKSQLISAFEKWINDYKNNPSDFESLDELDPEKQADGLLKYLGMD